MLDLLLQLWQDLNGRTAIANDGHRLCGIKRDSSVPSGAVERGAGKGLDAGDAWQFPFAAFEVRVGVRVPRVWSKTDFILLKKDGEQCGPMWGDMQLPRRVDENVATIVKHDPIGALNPKLPLTQILIPNGRVNLVGKFNVLCATCGAKPLVKRRRAGLFVP